VPASSLHSNRYGQDVGLGERTVEIMRQHTEKIYGVLRDGETVAGMYGVLDQAEQEAGTNNHHRQAY